MTQHTPGPWMIEYDNADDRGGGQWYAVGPAKIWFPYSSTEQVERRARADADLVSAAPELLASLLEFMNSRAPDYAEADHPGAYERARAALAKAMP